jgi:hypothetical protein
MEQNSNSEEREILFKVLTDIKELRIEIKKLKLEIKRLEREKKNKPNPWKNQYGDTISPYDAGARSKLFKK